MTFFFIPDRVEVVLKVEGVLQDFVQWFIDREQDKQELAKATADLNASSDRTEAAVAAGQPVT